jgi:dsDNA-binding SOS-regulon protein
LNYDNLENPKNRKCPLCLQILRGYGEYPRGDLFVCLHCGRFAVAESAKPRLFGSSSAETQIGEHRIRLSWLVRNENDNGREVEFTAENLDRLLEMAPPRLSPPRAAEALLLWVAERADRLAAGSGVQVDLSSFSTHRADSPDALGNLIRMMIESGWVQQSGMGIHLKPAGWTRAGELKQMTPTASEAKTNRGANRSKVFIVHGSDGENLLRLERLLRTRWSLDPVILRDKPHEGRTLIEKFEEEVAGSAYGLILMTPDDQIEGKDGVYRQARPNVIFELGYLCGMASRKKTCILFKKGTSIHSDLAGIGRVEFIEFIDEKVAEIETELRAGGVLWNSGPSNSDL